MTRPHLIRSGKVRYIGASNYQAWRLTRALWESDRHDLPRYETVQPSYHLLNRADYERELQALCLDQEIGVIIYSSLASGFLTGKYRADQALPTSPRAGGIQSRYMNERGYQVLAAVDRVAEAQGATPTQVALAWILARPGITTPIASATSPEQVQELLGTADVHLTDAQMQDLNDASTWQ